MRLMYNSVQFGDINASRIEPQRQLLRNAAGIGYRWRHSFSVTGSFTVASAADCTTKMNAIEAACEVQHADLTFQYDDGSATPNAAVSAATFTGVRCTGLSWLGSPGGQFATWRSFSCSFEWETTLGAGLPVLIDFDERVVIDNPPAQYAGLEAINGVDPAFFPTVTKPFSYLTQSGFAVGLSSYPVPATVAPLLLTANGTTIVQVTNRVIKSAPKRYGASGYDSYRIEWEYMWKKTSSISVVPNAWTV